MEITEKTLRSMVIPPYPSISGASDLRVSNLKIEIYSFLRKNTFTFHYKLLKIVREN